MQVPIILGGKTCRLCPTFSLLDQVEKALGETITTLAGKLADGELSLREIVVILVACVQPAVPETHMEVLLLESGFTHVTEALARMFALVFQAFDNNTVDVPQQAELHALQNQFPD